MVCVDGARQSSIGALPPWQVQLTDPKPSGWHSRQLGPPPPTECSSVDGWRKVVDSQPFTVWHRAQSGGPPWGSVWHSGTGPASCPVRSRVGLTPAAWQAEHSSEACAPSSGTGCSKPEGIQSLRGWPASRSPRPCPRGARCGRRRMLRRPGCRRGTPGRRPWWPDRRTQGV